MTTTTEAPSEIERMKDAAERMRREASWWRHGEECDRAAHEDCGSTQGGTYHCDNDDDQATCEAADCDCGITKIQRLVSEIIGDGEGMGAAAMRVNLARDTRLALKALVEAHEAGEAPRAEDWRAGRSALNANRAARL